MLQVYSNFLLLESVLMMCLFRNLSISPMHLTCWHSGIHSSFIILLISRRSAAMSPLSFLILVILFFSLFFLVGLTKQLSILLLFPQNQFSVTLIFSTVLHFIYLQSNLYHFFPYVCLWFNLVFFNFFLFLVYIS